MEFYFYSRYTIVQMTDLQAHRRLTPLIRLAHYRWNIPVIAELERRSGAKFVTLAHSLGAARGSLSTSLKDLISQGLVIRNPGYGHPMRPEYLLTPAGAEIGERCLRLEKLLRRRGEADLGYRKWTLPLVVAIGDGVHRFGEVRESLGAHATPRAVALGLKQLLSANWAERSLVDSYPPTAGYALMRKGRNVFAIVDGLCG